MATTSRWALRYPSGTDAPDIPLWMQRLANDLDGVAMDDQGLLDSRPTSTSASPGKRGRYYYATDTDQFFRDTGNGWVQVGGPAPLVTALPSSPVDGQRVDYLADPAGVVWPLRYRAAEPGAHKWYAAGATAVHAAVDASVSSTLAAYGDLSGSPGPAITLPLAGDFDVTHGAEIDASVGGTATGRQSFAVGATSASDADSVHAGPAVTSTPMCQRRKTGLAASTTITAKYKAPNGATFLRRWLAVTPIRVG